MSQHSGEPASHAALSRSTRLLRAASIVLGLTLVYQVLTPEGLFPALRLSESRTTPDSLEWGARIPTDVRTVRLGSSQAERDPFQRRGCSILVFFQSTCPSCEALAPLWSGLEEVTSARGAVIPVAWIALFPGDTGASAFVSRHRVNVQSYSLADDHSRRALGIRHWPQLWLVSDGVFRARLSRSPSSLKTAPVLDSFCAAS
jgi:hypothetical protein